MNEDLWCAYVNLLAAGVSAANARTAIKTMVCGDTAAKDLAATEMSTTNETACVAQAKLSPYGRATWYQLNSPLQTLQILPP